MPNRTPLDPRACLACGELFQPSITYANYCGNSCRRKARYARVKDEANAKRRMKYANPQEPERTCSTEGCDRAHAAKGLCLLHWKRANYVPVVVTKTCSQCGIEYTRSNRGGSKYCSRVCAKGAWWDANRPTTCVVRYGTCAWCESAFIVRDVRASFCSDECRRERGISVYRANQKCPDCGSLKGKDQQRCDPCAVKRRRDTDRATTHARRARKRQAYVETVRPSEIYERDGWRCGICNRAVNPILSYPHKMSASLDHIIPLAWDGEHSKANTQLAHWICNVKKGAREEVQGGAIRCIGRGGKKLQKIFPQSSSPVVDSRARSIPMSTCPPVHPLRGVP